MSIDMLEDDQMADILQDDPMADKPNGETYKLDSDVNPRIINILIDNTPETRLKRFLYIGKEYANYQPGCWFVHNYFIVKNVPSIEELAEDTEKQLVPIEIITEAFENNFLPHPETLMFALAVCCRQTKSQSLRHAAYKSVTKFCASIPNFILFIRFATKLNRDKELNYVTQGWGVGMRNTINNWYLSKEPLDLANCVTKYRSRYGWAHKDIIKMSHPKTDNPEKAAILKYVIYGWDKTSALMENHTDSNVKKIMKYIEKIEEFKHCEDENSAAGLLEAHKLSLDHVPGHLLKSKEVWNSLIPSMDIITLLHNLQRIHNLHCFEPINTQMIERVKDKLTNEENIARIKPHPALFLITMKNYEFSSKPMSREKKRAVQFAKKVLPKPPLPNIEITEALYNGFELSFNHLESTNLRYLVTISVNKTMMKEHVWPIQSSHVIGIEAACLIAMMLLRCENNVTVASFKNRGIHLIDIKKTDSFRNAIRKLQSVSVGPTGLSKPIIWAMDNFKEYDVFINVVDRVQERHNDSSKALVSYRNDMKLPLTKLINCAVCSFSTCYKGKIDKNVLSINGFDATVPIAIQAFVRSLF